MSFGDGISFAAASAGTGTFVYASSRASFLSLAQAVSLGELTDGATVSYFAVDSLTNPTQRAWGHGTFSAGGNSITRDAAEKWVNNITVGSGPLNFSVPPFVSVTALAPDLIQTVTDDTNVTGALSPATLTLGWQGTLAAARLNGNVVQSVTDDTNVTGSITAQALTLGWTGTLLSTRMPALSGDVTSSAGTTTTALANIPNDVSMAGDILATNIAAPSTPATGKTRLYVDSTQKILSAKNDAGTVTITVAPSSAPTHQFSTGIGNGGGITFAQPTAADLSNGVTGSGAVVLASSPTLTTPTLGAALATSINFGGSSLSAYVEGTWTPTIITDGTNGTPAYTTQYGSYERIGRLIVARFTLFLSGWTGSPTGNVYISGLPLTSTNTANDSGTCNINQWLTSTSFAYITGVILSNTSKIQIQTAAAGGTAGVLAQLTAAQAGTSLLLVGTSFYRV